MKEEGSLPSRAPHAWTIAKIAGNRAQEGGGLGNHGKNDSNSKLVLSFCQIRGNVAKNGGGINAKFGLPMAVINCRIECNKAFDDDIFGGGGGLLTDASSVELVGCLFCRNESSGFGGGMKSKWHPYPNLVNCTFFGNCAGVDKGGGLFIWNAVHPTMHNCIVWGNEGSNITTGGGSGGRVFEQATPAFKVDGRASATSMPTHNSSMRPTMICDSVRGHHVSMRRTRPPFLKTCMT